MELRSTIFLPILVLEVVFLTVYSPFNVQIHVL